MQQKKTKLDYFIESYASYGLQSEAKDVVSSHVQALKAAKALNKGKAKHGAAYIVETMKAAKFARLEFVPFEVTNHACVLSASSNLNNVTKLYPVRTNLLDKIYAETRPVKPVYVLRAAQIPDFSEQCATLLKIRADKLKTLASRNKKLKSGYSAKLAKNVASRVASQITDILAAFESASNNLTFKPPMSFAETLGDIRTTLNDYKFAKRELWSEFNMPDTHFLLAEQSTPVLQWLLGEGPKVVESCFKAIAKTSKSSHVDDIAKFDDVIDKLEKALCERLYTDLNGKLVRNVADPVETPWINVVDIKDVIRGEYVIAEIGAENVPIKLLSAKEETARELSETETRLSYSFESEECRQGIFAGIKALSKALESGLADTDDKVSFLSRFFVLNRAEFLQAYLDKAIASAVNGKGSADKKHLDDLNTLLSSFSLVISPRNGEQKNVGVLGASEIIHYVKFCAPWLAYKANDGGFYESTKWEGPSTVHRGNGFPVGNGQPCHYPAITLTRYLVVKKTIQAEVRITNRARKRHNDNLAKSK